MIQNKTNNISASTFYRQWMVKEMGIYTDAKNENIYNEMGGEKDNRWAETWIRDSEVIHPA